MRGLDDAILFHVDFTTPILEFPFSEVNVFSENVAFFGEKCLICLSKGEGTGIMRESVGKQNVSPRLFSP